MGQKRLQEQRFKEVIPATRVYVIGAKFAILNVKHMDILLQNADDLAVTGINGLKKIYLKYKMMSQCCS